MNNAQPATTQPGPPKRQLTDYEAEAVLSKARWDVGKAHPNAEKGERCLQAWLALCTAPYCIGARAPSVKPPPRGPDGREQAMQVVNIEVLRARMCPSPLAGKQPPRSPAATNRVKVKGRGATHPLVVALLRPRLPNFDFYSYIPWEPKPAPPTPATTQPTTTTAQPAPAPPAPPAPQVQTPRQKRPKRTALVQADEDGLTLLREVLWNGLIDACGVPDGDICPRELISIIAIERPTERPIKVRQYNAPHFWNAPPTHLAHARPRAKRTAGAGGSAPPVAASAPAPGDASGTAPSIIASAPANALGTAPSVAASVPATTNATAPLLSLDPPQKRAREEDGEAAEAPPAKRAATTESRQALETRNDGPTASTSSVPIGRDVQSHNIAVPPQGPHAPAGDQKADKPQPLEDNPMDCDPPVDNEDVQMN